LHRLFRKAIAEGNHNFAKRFFRYAIWHLARRSHQTRLMPKAGEAAAQLLYEFMDELENWIDRYEFMRAQYGLTRLSQLEGKIHDFSLWTPLVS
jgi:hypothetical protein